MSDDSPVGEFEFDSVHATEAGIEDGIPLDRHNALELINKWNSMGGNRWKYWI